MTKTKELRDLSTEELEAQLEEINQHLFELKNELKTARKLDKPHLVQEGKVTRCRILTLLTEREQGSES